MEIITAKTAGFCFGVKRCIDIAKKNGLENKCYTYGPLIHNDEVIHNLENENVFLLEDNNIKNKNIIIRSHGITSLEYKHLKDNAKKVIDATCPFVAKIHQIVYQSSKQGKEIIIVGDKNHPEVKGIKGWCLGKVSIINSLSEAENYASDSEKSIQLVAQTTYDEKKFSKIVEILIEKLYNLEVSKTICSATSQRQIEAREIASRVDAMIVIGDKKSSNTNRLYEICKEVCENTYYIQTKSDLKKCWFNTLDRVGITAGASTPNYIIEEVQKDVRCFF